MAQDLAARISAFTKDQIDGGRKMPGYPDSSGRLIGKQVVVAGNMAASAVANVPAEEAFPSQAAYLTAVVEALVAARLQHQEYEDDPENFGTGTINSVLAFVLQECDRLKIPRPIPNHWE